MAETEDSDSFDMEIDEEVGDGVTPQQSSSSALMVEPRELHNLAIPYDDQDDDDDEDQEEEEVVLQDITPLEIIARGVGSPSPRKSPSSSSPSPKRRALPDLRPIPKGPQPGTSTSTATEMETDEASDELAVVDHEEEIRKATTKYLQGEMSATDFASAMETLERLKFPQEEDERGGDQPSLVLLDPDQTEPRPHQEDKQQHVPEVILTEEEMDEEGKSEATKLRGEFFRTGDDMATFTVRKRRKMPPTIKSMMGEAHVRFARGDLEGAESICLEIIKEQPTYKDPFHTLAMIYENQGRVKRALQFFLISGLLDPKHFEEWPRLAEMSVEEGNVSQAIMCLRKAINCDSTNLKTHLRRSELLDESQDYRGALKGYHKVLNLCGDDGTLYMDVAKKVAGIHFKCNELDQAYEVLIGAFVKFSSNVTTAEMNLLAEVCISLKRYVKAITLFMRFSGVRFDPPVPKVCFKERSTFTAALNQAKRKCIAPDGLHTDLLQKLCIILIHLEAFEMAKPIVTKLSESEPLETFGIQMYEIAEAYLAKQQYELSLSILTTLVHTDMYSKAEIWLRYAECLFLLNRVEDSAEAYSKVIELAPGHKIARLNLSVILQKLGRYEVALQSLDQTEMADLMDQDLLVEKCNILLSRNRISEFFKTAMQLFSRHCPDLKNHDEAHALVITSQTNQMLQGLKSLRARKGEEMNNDITRINHKPSENAMGEWTVYLNMFRVLLKMNRPDLLNRLVYTVWSSPLFGKEERMKKDMDLQCAFVTIINGDGELTPIHIRSLITTFGLSTMVLKLLSLATRHCSNPRYGRQIIRLLAKRPTDTRMMMMSAHNSFLNGSYKYALMEYFALLKCRPNDPLIHLMISTTLLHISSQKSTSNRSQLTMQAVAFINKYAELRGECQEVFYNLGRLYHFIGLFRQAMAYYKRVLMTDPVDDRSSEEYNISDLKREAAFNIAQIYKSSNCWELAKKYIYRYCVI